MIFQFVAEHIHDGREGPSAIMAFKILDIFKDERRRSMMGDDLGRVEEKRALRIAQESVGSTERLFLGHPGHRKRLTRTAERRVGNESVSTCRSRWSQYH